MRREHETLTNPHRSLLRGFCAHSRAWGHVWTEKERGRNGGER